MDYLAKFSSLFLSLLTVAELFKSSSTESRYARFKNKKSEVKSL